MKEITSAELISDGIAIGHELFPETKYQFPKFKTIHNKLIGSFLDEFVVFPKTLIVELDNVFIAGQSGTLIYEDCIITDSCVRKEHLPQKQGYEINSVVASIVNVWAYNNYFHWLLNSMSRLSLIEKAGLMDSVKCILVNSNNNHYEMEGFNLFGVNTIPVLNCWWKCDKIIFPFPLSSDAVISPYGCNLLKEKFLPTKNEYPKKIAIVREKTRKITNHNEVYDYLESIDFKLVTLENMSFVEQVNLFSNADYIVGSHGAALANLVFCKPKTKVLEISSPKYINDCFRRVSAYCNLDYAYLMGCGEPVICHNSYNRLLDITVDMKNLKNSLEILN